MGSNHTEVRVLRKEDFVEIQALAKAGAYPRDIAAQVGVHPKTLIHTYP